uniref:TIM barrel protein n=1 Tax=Enterocloster clostridioformis TaxID=1531 RepID=UPI0025A4ED4E|nr:TIM barrel protein [Enterocloster clostridioformis]
MDQDTYWNQWLEGIGAYIDMMHIKDYSLGKDRAYQPEQLGEGILGYKEISRWLHENKPDMYLLREEMNPAAARKDIEFMKRL